MRKMLAVFMLLLLAFGAQAVTKVAMEGSGYISNSASLDTLSGTDSVSLKADWIPPSGWEPILVFETLTGASADTAKTVVDVHCYGPSGQHLYVVTTDTVVKAGGVAELGIGTAAAGFSYGIKLRNITGTGTKVVVNRVYLGRRQ